MHIEGIGDINRILEDFSDASGHGGFAVAGRTEEKDGAATGNGRLNFIEQFLGDHIVFEGLVETLFRYMHLLNGLSFHPIPIVFQGDGGGAHIAVEFQLLVRALFLP